MLINFVRRPLAVSRCRPCAWLFFVMSSCAAMNVAAHVDPEQAIEEIVVIGRWADLAGSVISASEGVVGQEELDIRPRSRSGEVLEVVPGLIITQHSGTGKSNQMFLRGFNLDHGTDFSTSIDGMPINMPSHGHGQGYIYDGPWVDINEDLQRLNGVLRYSQQSDAGTKWDIMTSRLAGEPDGGVDDIHLYPMEPRTVRASITWSFDPDSIFGGRET